MFVAQGCTVNRCVCMYVVSYIEESQFQRDTRCVMRWVKQEILEQAQVSSIYGGEFLAWEHAHLLSQ